MRNLPSKYEKKELAHSTKFYRDLEEGKLGGVCAGLAQRTGMPTVVWRLVFVFTTLLWGVGLPMYVILWAIMDTPPKRALPEATPEDLSPEDREIWEAVKGDLASLDLKNDK